MFISLIIRADHLKAGKLYHVANTYAKDGSTASGADELLALSSYWLMRICTSGSDWTESSNSSSVPCRLSRMLPNVSMTNSWMNPMISTRTWHEDDEVEVEDVEQMSEDPMLSEVKILDEPALEFRYGQPVTDPRDGLSLFGPYDADAPGHPSALSYGVVGTGEGIDLFFGMVERNDPLVDRCPE